VNGTFDGAVGFSMLPPVSILGEVSDGIVALVIFAIVVAGIVVGVAMGKGR